MMAFSNKKVQLPILLTLALLTLVVYLPVRNHDFVRYDDDVYVTNNPEVKPGLSWQGIKWAFVTDHGANWHPLTWLSLMLDCQLFGVQPVPFTSSMSCFISRIHCFYSLFSTV